MDIVVSQKNLSRALLVVSRVASSRTNLSILGNVLLKAEGKHLYIAATNLEVAATCTIPIQINKEGSITAPAKLFTELIANTQDTDIQLKVTNGTISIHAGQQKSLVNGVQDDEFPELPVVDENTAVSYEIAADEFKKSASQVVVCASADSTRPVLTGVYWHTFDKKLYLAATDGYRLAEKEMMSVQTDVSAIIPAVTVQEVLRSISDTTASLHISFDDSLVSFSLDSIVITSKLIDGNFPDYRQLIPSKNTTEIKIDKSALQHDIKLASLFSRETGGSVIIDVDIDKKEASLSSVGTQTGENTSVLQTKAIGGESASITFNSRYLVDALSVITMTDITIEFSGKLAPIVVESEKDKSYKHIIMPIKS